MLRVESISYAYKNSFRLQDVSFDLTPGEVLGIIGESGCGKTTLLKLIFGKLDSDKGDVSWKNEKVLGPSNQLIAGREDFKYVTQDFELMPYISVLDNIIKPLSRQYPDKNLKKAKELLKVVKLTDHEHRKVKSLSGGQKQRVALAQALAKTPELLLLDEPFSHIDSFFKNELRRELFSFLKKENITCIISTHDKADVLPYANKILVLKQGKMLDYRSPHQIYNNPKSAYLAGLFGDYNIIESKLISDKIEKEHTIVYPDEIELKASADHNYKIIGQYFMGEFYKIIVERDDKTWITKSATPLDRSSSYCLKFKVDKILSRLNY